MIWSSLNPIDQYKMLIALGSTVALIASVVACTKSRKYWSEMADKILLSTKYQLLGVRETFTDITNARYNRTELPRKSGRVAIVTGGSRGIGAAVVNMLLKCDMDVIIGCRKVEKGTQTIEKIRQSGVTDGNAKVYELDNTSLRSVKKFAESVKQDYDKVHVLINNAGIMFTPYGETSEGFEQQWGVNYLSHFLLTALLMPLLRNAGTPQNSARIINVSSCAHLLGAINFDDINNKKLESFPTKFAYAQSKLAQVIFTWKLQRLLKEKGLPIQVYSVHPGIVNTDLFKNSLIYRCSFIKNTLFKTPERGAITTVFVAINDKMEHCGGSYFSNCLESDVNPIVKDESTQEKLLQLSLEQAKLTDFFQYL